MQTSSLGWEIDDLLVYGVPSIDGEVARLAISCKSNVQVTAAGLPATFVTAAWKQWREPAPMDHSRDVIALVPGIDTQVLHLLGPTLKAGAPIATQILR
jgi:hypothetical protein